MHKSPSHNRFEIGKIVKNMRLPDCSTEDVLQDSHPLKTENHYCMKRPKGQLKPSSRQRSNVWLEHGLEPRYAISSRVENVWMH